jgi:hypothetical protein
MGTIHHITFATGNSRVTGLPYSDTQKLLVESIESQTNRKVVHHTYDLESLKAQTWFYKVEDYPTKYPDPWGRDGLYCAYKLFIANDLMHNIEEGDYIYYTDSSAYFVEPFTENIDRLFDYIDYSGYVCGSAGNDVKHNSFGCCDNLKVWKEIYPEVSDDILNKPHILASWYALKKNSKTAKFLKEWAKYFTHIMDDKPLCTYHHTVDQSIFNILAYKYNMKVFYNDKGHDHNKNHNNVHRQLNMEPDNTIKNLDKWFKNTNEL